MARYFDTLPDWLTCLACLTDFPVQQFKKERTCRPNGRLEWLVGEFCKHCWKMGLADALPPEAQSRYYEAVRVREHQRDLLAKAAGKRLADAYNAGRPNAKEAASPFNRARVELEAAWGPMEGWTRSQHYRHTVRMYEILGWDPAKLDPQSATARAAHEANLKDRTCQPAQRKPGATRDPYADLWEPDA